MAIRKRSKDKQRSTKHTHKTKDRVTWTRDEPGMNSGAPSWMRIMVLLPFSPLKPSLLMEILECWNRNNNLHGSFEVAIGW